MTSIILVGFETFALLFPHSTAKQSEIVAYYLLKAETTGIVCSLGTSVSVILTSHQY
jgi:hypothetical protein